MCLKRQMTTYKIRCHLSTITTQKTCCYLFTDDNTFFMFTSFKDHTPKNMLWSFCRWQRVFYVRHRPLTPADTTRFSPITHASSFSVYNFRIDGSHLLEFIRRRNLRLNCLIWMCNGFYTVTKYVFRETPNHHFKTI